MLQFHAPQPADRSWIQPVLYASTYPGADYTFNNMLFWAGYYGDVGMVDTFVTQHAVHHGKDVYLFPAGIGDLTAAISKLRLDAACRTGAFRLRGVTPASKAYLEEAFPGKFRFTVCRNAFDYLYTVEELSSLKGKKLQSKRNHCNRFEASFPHWYTAPITEQTLPECISMAEVWYAGRTDASSDEQAQLAIEKRALFLAFSNYTAFSLLGLALYDGERMVAFSLGERMRKTYFDVNFEKALPDVPGAYSMINREFSRYVARQYPEVEFLNREDDMGSPGLRKAKESYQPTLLLEKYFADWQED